MNLNKTIINQYFYTNQTNMIEIILDLIFTQFQYHQKKSLIHGSHLFEHTKCQLYDFLILIVSYSKLTMISTQFQIKILSSLPSFLSFEIL